MQRGLIWKRLALVALGLTVGLALSEAGLQVAAWATQRTLGDSLPGAWLTGNLRVMCLGDSNTYGLYLSREQAYPRQLESLWSERIETPKLEVLNLGVPGTNSSRLVRDLPRLLDVLSPQVVLVMVGVNDSWTAPFEIEDGPESLTHFAKRRSKLFKLYHLIRRGSEVANAEMIRDPSGKLNRGAAHRLRVGGQEFDASWSMARPGDASNRENLRANLERLVRDIRAVGARPVLITYPSRVGVYAATNELIRQASEATQSTLVDSAALAARRCKDVRCQELLFDDQHPREAGHELIARALLDALPRALGMLAEPE